MKTVLRRGILPMKYLVPTLILAYIFILSSGVGAKPRESEIEKALSKSLPKEWSLIGFKVDVSENYGSKVEPLWKYRFKGKVKLQIDTYTWDRSQNKAVFLKQSGRKGMKVKIFGIATAEIYQGEWRITFALDENPFYKYGKPRSSYKGRTIIVGTPEEQEFMDEISKKEIQRKKQQTRQLAQMPDQLATLRAGIVKESLEKNATAKGERIYQDAMAALDRGDVPSAQNTIQSLRALHRQLKAEYTLQIVSQPDTPSGVWRYPQNNSKARNYYIIVQAVTSVGKRLAVPITNEEDGKTQTVEMWGIRVSESIFNQIRQDKMDNGIIDKKRFGIKRRGFITPEYLYTTAGGMITKW